VEASALLAGIRTGRWLDAQVFAPIRWTVPALIPEGMRCSSADPRSASHGEAWASRWRWPGRADARQDQGRRPSTGAPPGPRGQRPAPSRSNSQTDRRRADTGVPALHNPHRTGPSLGDDPGVAGHRPTRRGAVVRRARISSRHSGRMDTTAAFPTCDTSDQPTMATAVAGCG
jgi:hypothetical protein